MIEWNVVVSRVQQGMLQGLFRLVGLSVSIPTLRVSASLQRARTQGAAMRSRAAPRYPVGSPQFCLELGGGSAGAHCTGIWTVFEPMIRPTEIEFEYTVQGKADQGHACAAGPRARGGSAGCSSVCWSVGIAGEFGCSKSVPGS